MPRREPVRRRQDRLRRSTGLRCRALSALCPMVVLNGATYASELRGFAEVKVVFGRQLSPSSVLKWAAGSAWLRVDWGGSRAKPSVVLGQARFDLLGVRPRFELGLLPSEAAGSGFGCFPRLPVLHLAPGLRTSCLGLLFTLVFRPSDPRGPLNGLDPTWEPDQRLEPAKPWGEGVTPLGQEVCPLEDSALGSIANSASLAQPLGEEQAAQFAPHPSLVLLNSSEEWGGLELAQELQAGLDFGRRSHPGEAVVRQAGEDRPARSGGDLGLSEELQSLTGACLGAPANGPALIAGPLRSRSESGSGLPSESKLSLPEAFGVSDRAFAFRPLVADASTAVGAGVSPLRARWARFTRLPGFLEWHPSLRFRWGGLGGIPLIPSIRIPSLPGVYGAKDHRFVVSMSPPEVPRPYGLDQNEQLEIDLVSQGGVEGRSVLEGSAAGAQPNPREPSEAPLCVCEAGRDPACFPAMAVAVFKGSDGMDANPLKVDLKHLAAFSPKGDSFPLKGVRPVDPPIGFTPAGPEKVVGGAVRNSEENEGISVSPGSETLSGGKESDEPLAVTPPPCPLTRADDEVPEVQTGLLSLRLPRICALVGGFSVLRACSAPPEHRSEGRDGGANSLGRGGDPNEALEAPVVTSRSNNGVSSARPPEAGLASACSAQDSDQEAHSGRQPHVQRGKSGRWLRGLAFGVALIVVFTGVAYVFWPPRSAESQRTPEASRGLAASVFEADSEPAVSPASEKGLEVRTRSVPEASRSTALPGAWEAPPPETIHRTARPSPDAPEVGPRLRRGWGPA